VFTVFLLSFKYGTRDITTSDKIVLVLTLLAVLVWWQLDNPLGAVLMVSAIDGAGYIPTIRKSFKDPWSETLSYWLIMAITDLLGMISNAEYNLLTITYLSVIFVANMSVFLVCVARRRLVAQLE
jgi:hypothetical protein